MSKEREQGQRAQDSERLKTAQKLGYHAVEHFNRAREINESLDKCAEFEQLQSTLQAAIAEIVVPVPEEPWSPPKPVSHSGERTYYEQGPKLNISATLRRRMVRNYRSALPLTEVAQALLRESLDAGSVDPKFLKERVSQAVAAYGLGVAEGSLSQQYEEDVARLEREYGDEYYKVNYPPIRYARYIEGMHQYAERYDETIKRIRESEEQFDPMLHMRLLGYTAGGEFYPEGDFVYAPQMHTYADIMTRTLRLATTRYSSMDRVHDTWATMVDYERNVKTPGEFRHGQIASLSSAAYAMMRDGVDIRPIHAVILLPSVMNDINYAIDPYNMHLSIQEFPSYSEN